MSDFRWRSESDEPGPTQLSEVDDRLTADAALKRVRAGEYLLYTGDFQNARQLLGAMSRRLPHPRTNPAKLLEVFRAERRARAMEHDTLSRIVVALDASYKLSLARAPDVFEACRQVWGAPDAARTVVPLKTLQGMLGAAEWRKKGLEVPGLRGTLVPHYGVYVPTRTDYVELLSGVKELAGKTVFDVGTGTGVLGFIMLQRGAASVVATDVDERAVACANENAKRLALAAKFTAKQGNLFPEGRADVVVCNPPWIPEPPKNRVDRAVFDEDSTFLTEFLKGLPAHLNVGGEGLLILSDLAVLLGLREAGWLEAQFEAAGLTVKWTRSKGAKHSKSKDKSDALHEARSKEQTTIYALTPRQGPAGHAPAP